jgi:hypothetical protein
MMIQETAKRFGRARYLFKHRCLVDFLFQRQVYYLEMIF